MKLLTEPKELPPRARRIRQSIGTATIVKGTTSACAENTQVLCWSPPDSWNYLRVRGEYAGTPWIPKMPRELPPRARRIPVGPQHTVHGVGTTSACAENTFAANVLNTQKWNYLRVRGEYMLLAVSHSWAVELPPRARRIPADCGGGADRRGTTSACAENTPRKPVITPCGRNYLRVRGEYS